MQYWLLKTEPGTYSFAQLLKDKKTGWSGVRNFQARNFLREIKKGDLCLIYHSGEDKAVVGLAQVTGAPYADPDPKKPGDWVQVDIAPIESFKKQVTLKEIKAARSLATLALVKHSRLSVMPVTDAHFKELCRMAGARGSA